MALACTRACAQKKSVQKLKDESRERALTMFRLSRSFAAARRTLFTSASLRNAVGKATQETPKPVVQSSCAAGTVLNLKIRKSGTEPVALEDHDYPEWLWNVLDHKSQEAKLEADPAKKAKKHMRTINKKKIKMNNFIAQM